MKKTLSILLAVIIILCNPISAFAMRKPLFIGDVARDGGPMDDVVLTQQYLANLVWLSKRQLYAADVDNDNEVTLKDVVTMQKHIAKLIENYEKEDDYNSYVGIKNMYADHLSGRAMPGEPITFTVVPAGGVAPFSYEFSINGDLVQQYSDKNTLEYTFKYPGEYDVVVTIYNSFDEVIEHTIVNYQVAEPFTSDKPMVKAFYLDRLDVCDVDKDITFTATAFMGEGPYLYRFLLDDKTVTDDFTKENNFTVKEPLEIGDHTVTVQLKDKNSGDSFISETFTFEVTEEKLA